MKRGEFLGNLLARSSAAQTAAILGKGVARLWRLKLISIQDVVSRVSGLSTLEDLLAKVGVTLKQFRMLSDSDLIAVARRTAQAPAARG